MLPSLPGMTNPLAAATSFSSTLPLTHIPQPMYASPFQQGGLTPIATAAAAAGATAPRPTMFPQIIYWYPTPPVSPQTYYSTNTGPSMVVMRGLPFNVSLQDILNFFQGFPEVCPLTEMAGLICINIFKYAFLVLFILFGYNMILLCLYHFSFGFVYKYQNILKRLSVCLSVY